MKVPRVKNLSREDFVENYLLKRQPVIITDGMENWDVEQFYPAKLKENFGDHLVQIYDDLFNLQNVDTLETYLDNNFNRTEEQGRALEYTRWYTKLKEIEFYWSDEVFQALKKYWSHPYFAPIDELAIPYSGINGQKNITEVGYPYKGLFVSGKGSRTRLHKDPFGSHAILCQFYGKKKMFLYHPDKEKEVMKDGEFVDLMNVDHAKFPNFKNINADYEDTLEEGEIVLYPSGWFHDVTCTSDSVSITWNLVHMKELPRLYDFIEKNPKDSQLEILRFFLNGEVSANADVDEFRRFYEDGSVSITL